MRASILTGSFLALAAASTLEAVPPLVSDDALTVDHETFELYAGTLYESVNGSISRQVPIIELDYGLTERQEVSLTVDYLSQDGKLGLGDAVVGTKRKFLIETDTRPGIAGAFEVNLPTGSGSKDLGIGDLAYSLQLDAQKKWGWFTAIANIGYTLVGTADLDEGGPRRKNVWFAGFAQEYEATKNLKLLSEIYWQSGDALGDPNQVAANVGFEYKLQKDFTVEATVGESLRYGGHDLRVYIGLEWDFDAPWARHKDK